MLEDFLMNFLCIYLDEGKGGGGGYTIACISASVLQVAFRVWSPKGDLP